MRTTSTNESAYRMYNTHLDSYERNVLLNDQNQYPAVCDDVACDINSDKEVARVDDMLNSSEGVRHLNVALDDKQPGTDCKLKVLLTSQFYSI